MQKIPFNKSLFIKNKKRMKQAIVTTMFFAAIFFAACSGGSSSSTTKDTAATSTTATDTSKMMAAAKYTCTMHPEVNSDTPGKCPKCGMDLVPMKDSSVQQMNMDTIKH